VLTASSNNALCAAFAMRVVEACNNLGLRVFTN
jgi:hypothetical protein